MPRIWNRWNGDQEMTVNSHHYMIVYSSPSGTNQKPPKAGSSSPNGERKAPGRRSNRRRRGQIGKRAIESRSDVKAGPILFGKKLPERNQIDGQEYLILREEEILVKLGAIAKAASGKKYSSRRNPGRVEYSITRRVNSWQNNLTVKILVRRSARREHSG